MKVVSKWLLGHINRTHNMEMSQKDSGAMPLNPQNCELSQLFSS